MAGGTDEQRIWLSHVLDIDFGDDDDEGIELEDEDIDTDELEEISTAPEKPTLSVPRTPLLPIWIEAKEDLDTDIDTLQRKLRADGDEGLLRIAEYGLHKVTEGNSVRLMAALRDADSAKSPEAVAKAYDAVQAFRTFLTTPGVDVIEDNPVDVDVPVRRKLGKALDQLTSAMQG